MRSRIPERLWPPPGAETAHLGGFSLRPLSGREESVQDRRLATARSHGSLKRPYNVQPSGSQPGRKNRKVPVSLPDNSDDSGDDSDDSDGSACNYDGWDHEDFSGYGLPPQEEENVPSKTNQVSLRLVWEVAEPRGPHADFYDHE